MGIEAAIRENNAVIESAQRKIEQEEQLCKDYGNRYQYIVINKDEKGNILSHAEPGWFVIHIFHLLRAHLSEGIVVFGQDAIQALYVDISSLLQRASEEIQARNKERDLGRKSGFK